MVSPNLIVPTLAAKTDVPMVKIIAMATVNETSRLNKLLFLMYWPPFFNAYNEIVRFIMH